MTVAAEPVLPVSSALSFACALLIPWASAGLALINAGLGRSRSAAHALLASLCAAACAALAYFAVGFAWQAYPGLHAHSFAIAGKSWDWIGAGPAFLSGLPFDGSPASLAALAGVFLAGLAALIPLGSGADRWRLGASLASSAILGGLVFPLFAHWSWGGGWLAGLGRNYGLGTGFLDFGGAGAIHVVGGLSALTMAWILGPRIGKYNIEGMPAAIPGHNAAFVLFGCFLAWIGWIGVNCAGTLLFSPSPSGVFAVPVNVTLAAGAAALAAAATTRVRFGKPDASICANGWVGGLVSISAAAGFVQPAEAVVIGGASGLLTVLSVEWLELHLKLDDPGGAISVHALGGVWGLVAAGLFARVPGSQGHGQLMAQIVGVSTLVGCVLPLVYGSNWLIGRFLPHRAAPEGERLGLDLHELGAGAYPDFMSHSDESWPR